MRKWILGLIVLGSPVFAAPTIVPSTASVYVGGQIQFTSPDSVNWSLAPGSTGTITAGGLYTAPPSLFAKNVIGGCLTSPNDAIWNVDITSLPVDANSATRIANVGGTGHLDMTEAAMPINLMTNATPTDTMNFFYTTASNGRQFPITAAPYRGVENSLYPADYFAQDRHQLGVNTDTCQFTEIYNYYPVGTATIPEACPTCNAQSGVQYGPMSYQLADAGTGGGSIDAAGMYIMPLLVRYDELKSGVISHALRFTLSNGYNYSGFLWPATNISPQCGSFTTCFPYGSRLRLKASYNDSGLLPAQRVVTAALKKYGMFDADNGQSLHIQSAADVFADSTTYAQLDQFRFTGPTFSDFEQVDESSLMVSSATSRTQIQAANHTQVDNYAIVVATKIADNTTSYVYIALQPVTAGFKNTPFPAITAGITAMSGTPQFQIDYWVRGATDTAVTCTMSPLIGNLTSDCLYTAPASGIVASSTTIIKIRPTNIAVLGSSVSFPMTIYSSDAVRVDIGGKAASISSPAIPYDAAGNFGPDSHGKFWAADPIGTGVGWYSLNDNSSPQSSWPSSPVEVGLNYTERHGVSDACWSGYAPNGNYTLTVKHGTSDQNQVNLSSITIDAQNVTILSTATAVIPGFATFTPSDHTGPVQVTNGTYYFCVRQKYSGNFPALDAWMLNFDSPLSVAPREQVRGRVRIKGNVRIK